MKRWRVNSIASRIAVTIVLAIVLGVAFQFAVSLSVNYLFGRLGQRWDDFKARPFMFTLSYGFINPRFNRQMLAGRIAGLAQIIEHAPATERSRLAAEISQPGLRAEIRQVPDAEQNGETGAGLELLRQMILVQLGDLTRPVILAMRHVNEPRPDAADATSPAAWRSDDLVAEIALPDRRWLAITAQDVAPGDFSWWRVALVLATLFVVIGLLSVWTARRLATPISAFADAAERLGVDTAAPPLAERGPHELRIAIRAFNRMQDRLRRFVDDRTQMVAAMSHDLKTPLTRLRLRAEFVEDAEQQRKMLDDLDSMSAMIESTLAFARDDAEQEPRMLVDLGALVEDVCENASDAGGRVSFSVPHGVDVVCRPTAITRAVANLIDNAVKYGGTARAELMCEPGRVVIAIDDKGPGIPANEQERVFAPFYRLERSRNRDTGGVGLGLAVARTIAREHGGDITLANIASGGLRARVELPA
jgi:signal transduction histidine kinase